MATLATNDPRVQLLNGEAVRKGDYVLYWMQQSQRAHMNPALEYAATEANRLQLPLLVVFGLMDDYPEANLRHYYFMLQGLADVAADLAERGIGFVLAKGHPAQVALQFSGDSALVVCDWGYLRHQKAWRAEVALGAGCAVVAVEGDVVVPVETASTKREYAARTIRRKIMERLDDFVAPLEAVKLKKQWGKLSFESLPLDDVAGLANSLKLDRSVGPVDRFFTGGNRAARACFEAFLKRSFEHYAENRNQPQTNHTTLMSLYLHFGQVSPVWLVLASAERASRGNVESFVEELVVRRELAMNFCHFSPDYDSYETLPSWARQTLAKHGDDERAPCYGLEALEGAQTEDPYWNAAMEEMVYTGYMHNYMRMYWGKKILEWSPSPEEAYRRCLYLNNKYFVDGRDANSFCNVGWIFGLHDRPWTERAIFGTVRYMNANGLKRKCDIGGYVSKVAELKAEALGEDLFSYREG